MLGRGKQTSGSVLKRSLNLGGNARIDRVQGTEKGSADPQSGLRGGQSLQATRTSDRGGIRDQKADWEHETQSACFILPDSERYGSAKSVSFCCTVARHYFTSVEVELGPHAMPGARTSLRVPEYIAETGRVYFLGIAGITHVAGNLGSDL